MTKSFIEKELERNSKCVIIGDIPSLTIKDVNLILQKVRKELRKKAICYHGYPHLCKKHPEDCELKINLEDVEEVLRCNRPNWRKKVLGRKGFIKFKRRGTKIKSKEWEKVDKQRRNRKEKNGGNNGTKQQE